MRAALCCGSRIALAVALAAGADAATIDSTWTGAGGSWSDALSWSAGVPANGGGSTYRAFVDGGNAGNAADVAFDLGLAEIDALTIDAGDRVTLGADQNLAIVGGTLDVAGELRLAGGPGFAVLRAGGTLDLSGGGTLSMGDAIENTLSGVTGSTPHLVNHDVAIAGAGRIGIDVAQVTNHAAITATGANPLELNPNLQGYTGSASSTLRASAGTLVLLGRNGGDFAVDGTVESLAGGSVELREFADATGAASWTADGGALLVDAGSTLATTGSLAIANGGSLTLDGLAGVHDATVGAGGAIEVGGTLEVAGDFSIALTDETDWSWDPAAALVMSGGVGAPVGAWAGWAALEVGGNDLGVDPASHAGNPLGFSNLNLSLPELVIGDGAHVVLADLIDNGNRGGGTEALYVDTLRFSDAAGRLNLNGVALYYNTLIGDSGQILDVVVPEPGSGALLALGLVTLAARRRGRP